MWVDDDLVTAVVSEPDDFVWLERRTGWFYLPSVAKNAVVSRVVKMLSVAGGVDLADLHAGIRRDERMKEFVMPEYILGELCERIPGVAVDGGLRVRPSSRVPPQDVLETHRADAGANPAGTRRGVWSATRSRPCAWPQA